MVRVDDCYSKSINLSEAIATVLLIKLIEVQQITVRVAPFRRPRPARLVRWLLGGHHSSHAGDRTGIVA